MAQIGILPYIFEMKADVAALRQLVLIDPASPPLVRLAALAIRQRSEAIILRDQLRLSNDETESIAKIGAALTILAEKRRPRNARDMRENAYRNGRSAVIQALLIDAARRGTHADPDDIAAAGSAPSACPFTGALFLNRGITPGKHVGLMIQDAESAWIEGDFPTDGAVLNTMIEVAIKNNR